MDELTEKQQSDMISEVEKWAKKIAPYLGFKAEDVVVDNDEWYDGMVTLCGMFSIVPYMEKHPHSILHEPSPRYLIGHAITIPGVHYYPDGSGEPDAEDFVEDEHDIPSAKSAVIQAFRMCHNHVFDQSLQSFDEAEMQEEWEEYVGEMARDVS